MASQNGNGSVDLRSFSVNAILLKEDEYGELTEILRFRPSAGAVNQAQALKRAWTESGVIGKVTEFDVEHIFANLGDDLKLFMGIIISKSRCPSCGAERHTPREWCHDAEGCEKFRNEPERKNTSLSEQELLAELQEAFGNE